MRLLLRFAPRVLRSNLFISTRVAATWQADVACKLHHLHQSYLMQVLLANMLFVLEHALYLPNILHNVDTVSISIIGCRWEFLLHSLSRTTPGSMDDHINSISPVECLQYKPRDAQSPKGAATKTVARSYAKPLIVVCSRGTRCCYAL